MRLLDSIIDPADADPDIAYVICLKDDDWDHWASVDEAMKYHGRRRSADRWSLRDLAHGTPVDWGYADEEIVVLGEVAKWPPSA